MDKILLWIPMYNCEKQIVRVLDQLTKKALKYLSEVIIINNRSTDQGEAAVVHFLEKSHIQIPVKLMRNDKNYGLGGSHKVAFHYALKNNFDYIITLHGDDQAHISDIYPVLKKGLYKNYDCCLGSRFMKQSKLEGYSRFRTIGNKVYNILFSLICRFKVKDLGSGLNLYHVPMLADHFYIKFPDNLMFNYCMVMAIRHYRQKVIFFPISWREEDQTSNVKLLSQARRVLELLTQFAVNPSRLMQKDLRQFPAECDAQLVNGNLQVQSQKAYTAQIIFEKLDKHNEK